MLLCEACGAACSAPPFRVYREWDPDGRERREPWCACPFCGESELVPAFPCEGGSEDCTGWRREEDLLCPGCAASLRRQVTALVLPLRTAEREQLDRWLEGAGVRQFCEER